jgi:hypothetical protein
MLLLLDEQISPAVATGLRRTGIDAIALRDWSGAAGLGASDSDLLETARAEQRVLVSYDRRTLEPLLKDWAETGLHHSGTILVDDKTVRPNDIGGLVRALQVLVVQSGDENWTDRVVLLRRG